jgi:ubiquinone/menaquinone biosynthesis C-methylase UbiE
MAERAAHCAPVPIRVVDAGAERLPFEDASFDVAVTSLVLCSVPDQRSALKELQRVLRRGGHLRFQDPAKARLQDRVEWIWPHLVGGCHPNRDTLAAITEAGFQVETCRRFEFCLGPLCAPTSPHVIGTAIRH